MKPMPNAWTVFLKMLLIIASTEAVLMLLGPQTEWWWLADSLLLTALVSPFFYRWVVKEWESRREAENSSHLLNTLARQILESVDFTAALEFTLREICETSGWVYGEAWLPSADGQVLELHSGRPRVSGTFEAFREASARFTFSKGVGLPGRAWADAKPVWVPDVTRDFNFPRKTLALEAGLKGGLAIPVLSGRRVTLVLAFYLREARPGVDERMVELISGGASQLGSLIERKRAEDDRARLAKANEMKNRLFAIAAHDLRNPLTIMIGHIALMQEEVSDGPRKEELDIVQRKCRQMLGLIDGMLDSSIIESRGLELDFQSMDLGEFLERLCADARLFAKEKSIALSLRLEPGLPPVTADTARLQQIFDNLIGNAIKYSPPGKSVVVSARAAAAGVEVSVADEGPGIAGQDIPRLFTEFGRGESRPTGGERSVGLGLSIAQRLARAHGGSIRVESSLGAGTTFIVLLPLSPPGEGSPVLDLG